MKSKLISLLLILATLLSLFAVFPSASETEAASTVGKVKNYLHYRNTFGDRTDDTASTITLSNAVNSTVQVKTESNGNKYALFNFNDASNNVFFQIAPSSTYSITTSALGYMILEFDINDFGNLLNTDSFFEIHSGTGSLSSGRVAATNVLNISNDGSTNYLYLDKNHSNKISLPKNQWVRIRCELSISSSTATKYNFRCYVGDKYFDSSYKLGSTTNIEYFRIGSSRCTNQIMGMDNITVYTSSENIPSYEDFVVASNTILMKVGAENASHNGARIELQNTPILVDKNIFCPVDILEQITNSTCPSSYYVELDGVKYIHIDNVYAAFKLHAQSYDMGLISISAGANPLGENIDHDTIVAVLKSFIFNLPTMTSIKSDVQTYTNNFDHPYLLADENKFEELRTIYQNGKKGLLKNDEENLLYKYITNYLNSASSYLSQYAVIDKGTYSGLNSGKIPVNTYYDKYKNNGYDNGGRASIPTTPLMYFAFAYQITGEINYAMAAYDYSLALGEWNHWGPAHFLNCADAAAPFAIAYDWLYDAYVTLGEQGKIAPFDGERYDQSKLATILLKNAVVPGYIQSNAINTPWPNNVVESRYATKESNWNAVCTSGMIAATLAIMGEETSVNGITFDIQTKNGSGGFNQSTVSIENIGKASIHVGLNTYSDYAAKLVSMNLTTFTRYGLAQYVPDGSYVESPGYWAYGTNTLYRMVACLESATGDDYGIMDAWGIDKTAYFAVHAESSDYKCWNFNDGSDGQQDTSFFFFVGNFYGDDNLVRIRKKHLSNGKSASIYDILYYDTSITGEPVLELEYYMQGVDGYSVRSSWDKGAIYAAIIGGSNNVSHGHMDAGTFIYHNKGRTWFADLGADNYNYSPSYFSNYKLYRLGAEGHNIICLAGSSAVPYGQIKNASAPIIDYSTGDVNGGYTIIDTAPVYGSEVKSAKRGMLFTDSRSSVVIQDEITFNGTKTAYWFGHYRIGAAYVDDVKISADGRTAFMLGGDDIIRVSIVSDNKDLKFEIMDCYTYVLDVTIRTDRNTMDGASTENNRDAFSKLAIKCENVTSLNLAVVIEHVDTYEIGTEYDWTAMSDWKVSRTETPKSTTNFEADYESGSIMTGSVAFNYANNLFSYKEQTASGNTYATIYSALNGNTNADTIYSASVKNESIDTSLYKYIVADMDIFTETSFPENTTIGFTTKSNGYTPIVQLSGRNLTSMGNSVSFGQSWKHLTFIYDVEAQKVYVYVANAYLTSITGVSVDNIFDLSIVIPKGTSSAKKTSISFDNVLIRALGTEYVETQLKSLLAANSPLYSWNDKSSSSVTASYLAMANNEFLYTYSDIQTALNNGYKVTLMRDTIGRFNVTNQNAVIDTRGYDFDYTSSNYVAKITDNVITFKSGTVVVNWHIGNITYTETYTKSDIATFKQTSSKIGAITEEVIEYADGGIGFKYYTTGWSRTKNGKALAPEDMIVSEGNCDFWLVNNVPIDCLFVVENSLGKFVPYYDSYALITELKSNSGSKKVVLCSDLVLTNIQSIGIHSAGKNLYLNNYKITHTDNSHLFIFSESATANFNVYGPGTIERTGTHTVFTSGGSSTTKTNKYGIVAQNVTFKTSHMLGDLRVGQHKFIDCEIYQNNTASVALFDLWNKNTTMTNEIPANLHTITLDGCTVRRDIASNAVFSFTSTTYSEVFIIDSTIISASPIMKADSNLVKLYVSGSSSISAPMLASNTTLEYKNVKFFNGVVTNLNLATLNREYNSVLANNYNSTYNYKISTQYATVNWLNLSGNVLHTEYVAVGDMPKVANDTVKNYLASISDSYSYNTDIVTTQGTINLKPYTSTTSNLLYNINIASDFALSIYVSKTDFDSNVKSIVVDGAILTKSAYSEVDVNGAPYYKYSIMSINPAKAADKHTVVIRYNDNTEKVLELSAVDYLNDLLAKSYKDDEKILAIKILNYFASAYIYAGKGNSTEYRMIKSIVGAYTEYDVIFGGLEKVDTVDVSALHHAIYSARLSLSAAAKLRLTLNSGFTGKLTVTYLGETYTYVVNNGMYNNTNYIDIVLPASGLLSDVQVSDGTSTVTYSVNAYYTMLDTSNKALKNMLFCLAEYSKASTNYINN